MKIKNYYQILEIDPFASQEEIKRAYFACLKAYHPDKKNGNNCFAYKRFQAALEAYEALNTPEKRASYDELLKIELTNQAHNAQRMSDLKAKNDNKTKSSNRFSKWFFKSNDKKAERT